VIDAATSASLLEIQRVERAVARAEVARPGFLLPRELDRVRYLLGFARVTRFAPRRGGKGKEIDCGGEVAPLRAETAEAAGEVVRRESEAPRRLRHLLDLAKRLGPTLDRTRTRILEHHAAELSADDLDDEAGRPVLVSVAGGGGGAGFVYVGAYEALERAGIVPAYVIGASIGALLGLFRARRAAGEWLGYAALAESLVPSAVFSPFAIRRRFGLPGLLRLHLRPSIGQLFTLADGRAATIGDLEIPYECVVGGIRRRSFDQLPRAFFDPPSAAPEGNLADRIGRLMWQVAAFFDPRLVKPIVLGGDDESAKFDAVDAAGFSAAIPGVLQYDLDDGDEASIAILESLCAREDVAAIVDGGVAANVPVEIAWRRIHDGKLGTRNAVYLAFDCFHPQWDPRHLWLQPITQAVQLQMLTNAPYAHWVVRFDSTLSPPTLTPDPSAMRAAVGWGREAIADCLPVLQALLRPASWRAST